MNKPTKKNISIKHKLTLLKAVVLIMMLLFPMTLWMLILTYANSITFGVVTKSVSDSVSAFVNLLEPIYANPTKLIIDSLGLTVNVKEVGIGKDGVMETPKEWNMAGWFANSSKPGELGNVVINGHYDDSYGQPAAFYKLKNLKIDDTVQVVDKFGKTYTYRVVDSFFLDINDPKRLDVLGSSTERDMTLITCGGVWAFDKGTYNKRLVIRAKLI